MLLRNKFIIKTYYNHPINLDTCKHYQFLVETIRKNQKVKMDQEEKADHHKLSRSIF
jgi:hypothetical protein